MAWFDPNKQTFDPSQFNYVNEQKKLQLGQALAKQLMQTEMPQGQMVSGRYVAPGWGAQLAAALSKVFGAYQTQKMQDQEGSLNEQSIQALQHQLQNAPQPTERYIPTNKQVDMGPPVPPDVLNPSGVQSVPVDLSTTEVSALDGGPLAGAAAAQAPKQAPDAPNGPLAAAIAAKSAPDANGGLNPYGVAYETEKVSTPPTTGDQIAYYAKIANTGPLGQSIASQAINNMFGAKGEYQVVKGDDGQFMVFNNKTGAYQMLGGGAQKPIQTIDTPNGLVNVYKDGTTAPAVSRDGVQPVTKASQEFAEKQSKTKAELTTSIADGQQQLADIIEGTSLLQKVGTGRLQTPFNKVSAYLTDSTDYDKMTRLFSQEKLEAAKRWLSGQGSVTEAERALIGSGTFNPEGSTQANLDYANTLIKVLKRNLAIQQERLEKVQPTAPMALTPPVPARRKTISEQDLGGF